MLARSMFAVVAFNARKGLAGTPAKSSEPATPDTLKKRAGHTGVRGETRAYWYLRRQGYVLVARNFTLAGPKRAKSIWSATTGPVLAFVEVKTRTKMDADEKNAALQATPESAVKY